MAQFRQTYPSVLLGLYADSAAATVNPRLARMHFFVPVHALI